MNDKVYHIEDQVPQTTYAPLCERLVRMEEKPNTFNEQLVETNINNVCDRKGDEQVLIDKFLAFDNEASSMKKWFNIQ